jgi:hypothetical protein
MGEVWERGRRRSTSVVEMPSRRPGAEDAGMQGHYGGARAIGATRDIIGQCAARGELLVEGGPSSSARSKLEAG